MPIKFINTKRTQAQRLGASTERTRRKRPEQITQRKVGERAGMDRSKILQAALSLWLKKGPEGCSIRAVAAVLGISPTTIHSHFKGGAKKLKEDLAREALAKSAPPYKPGQDSKDYLRQLFRSLLEASRQNPHLGSLIVIALTEDPLFSPVFAERLCVTLTAISKKLPLAIALQHTLNRLAGMVVMETSRWAFVKPQVAKATLAARISGLTESEFSTLKSVGETLALGPERRSKAGYLERMGFSTADSLIQELQRGAQ
jgi:AcrR family transcriptional regulator